MRARRLPHIWPLLLLLALVALAGGCGDDEAAPAEATTAAPTTTAPTGTPKERFIASGDAICQAVQTEATDLSRRADELQIQSESLPASAYLKRSEQLWTDQITYLERFRSRFAALGVPPGQAARVREIIRALDESIGIARRIRAVYAQGRYATNELMTTYSSAVVRENSLFRDFGFEVCGHAPIL